MKAQLPPEKLRMFRCTQMIGSHYDCELGIINGFCGAQIKFPGGSITAELKLYKWSGF